MRIRNTGATVSAPHLGLGALEADAIIEVSDEAGERLLTLAQFERVEDEDEPEADEPKPRWRRSRFAPDESLPMPAAENTEEAGGEPAAPEVL